MTTSAPNRSIEFRNTTLGATIAVLRDTEPVGLADSLHKMLGGMPDFFNGEATILDFSGITKAPGRVDWAGLLSLLRRYQLQPIGVRNLPAELSAAARQAGLAILDNLELRERPASDTPRTPPPAPAPKAEAPPQPAPAAPSVPMSLPNTLFVERPLRSGQQVYARGGDLVLLAGMSNGAEVIADGSIHCFGPLRGRALAGAQGNSKARIIATNFGPELVSIAGVYRTFEKGIPEAIAGRGAMVRLNDAGNAQTIEIEPQQLD
ncbi:septum site-determining protein MinC [Parazoarcus communis]|uniref:Probable septum site-determining protein MinC n=1 Tax=Parazoarcus communis TaxID=41977 RepID=A0A2U8H5H4_9RHOO|nr:septum site-determining protein MinC [Parazoarcus communis]AWI80914.1 septum site-determining protein MinC [Parazoarcus communis]